MNKRGLIGKILIILGITILILGVVIGITAYQTYDLIKVVNEEKTNLENNIAALQNEDCTKIAEIELSTEKIKIKATSACKNPIINYAISKIEQIPIKCGDLQDLESQIQENLTQIKNNCTNKIQTV
jgi:beta-lactamase regulating signal transducer with metallopeptidase domain